jgi:peptidoglycan/LPS O-acetylase OafA/YrhL
MHRPPAVAWDLATTRWQLRVSIALVLLATLVWLGFLTQQGWGYPSFILLLALLAGVLLAAMAGQNASGGQLRWDGEQWHWTDAQDHAVRTMVCMLDLQVVLLLQVNCDQGTRHWFWLDAGDKPIQWKALRRAIVASAKVSQDEVDTVQRDA